MKISIDKSGRIVIPKIVRQHLGLRTGSILQLIEHEREIILKIIENEPLLQHKNGIVVFTGKAVDDATFAMKTIKNKRSKKVVTHKKRNRLIQTTNKKNRLGEILTTLEPLEEDFPPIDDL